MEIDKVLLDTATCCQLLIGSRQCKCLTFRDCLFSPEERIELVTHPVIIKTREDNYQKYLEMETYLGDEEVQNT